MSTVFRQRSILLSLAFTGFVAFAVFRAHTRRPTMQELQELSEEQRLRYYYLMALRDMHGITVYPPKNIQEVLAYISEHTPNECPACQQWFPSEVTHCPDHTLPTREVSHSEYSVQIADWEAFKDKYMEKFHLKTMPRKSIIRLAYWRVNSSMNS